MRRVSFTNSRFDSPQQRQRNQATRKSLFTLADLGTKVQQRFLLRQRLAFALWIYLALAAMWIMSWLASDRSSWHAVGLFAATILFWLFSFFMRLRYPPMQILLFVCGWVALGATLGSLAQPSALNPLANVTILAGASVAGCAINTTLFKRHRSAFAQFLLLGPWLLAAFTAALYFPAGEWVLAASGASAVLLVFLLLYTSDQTLRVYQPGEYLAASADVIWLACHAAWQNWSGQD